MSLSRPEKMYIGVYRSAAKLAEAEYRKILGAHAGCTSAKDPKFTDLGFRRVMAALEERLFQRVHAGLVPDPIDDGHRYIRSEYYWRRQKAPTGRITKEQIFAIEQLWADLCRVLPESQRNPFYFAGIVEKATGRPGLRRAAANAEAQALTAQQGWMVRQALEDRLHYAERNHHD